MRVAANKGLKCSARITLTSQGPLLIEERSGPAVTRAQVGGAEPGPRGQVTGGHLPRSCHRFPHGWAMRNTQP